MIVQFPVFVQLYTQKRLIMYQIETVPVPILDKNEQAHSYTELKKEKPYIAIMLCKAVQLLELFSLIVNMSRGNLLHDSIGTVIHNCSSSGSLFFATLRQNN